jgi:broad specificity phosphatase PhoE
MTQKPLLILARHGQTKLNKGAAGESGERIRGWSDVPLDEKGKQDAIDLAKKLATMDIEIVYTSPLDRALETGRAVADAVGVEEIKVGALRPWNLGVMTKQLVKDVLPAMKEFIRHEDEKVPMGESFSDFRVRCLAFIHKCCQAAAKDNKIICCVAHTRNLQLVKAWLANGSPKDFSIDLKTMEDYTDETQEGGFLEVDPHEILGPEWKHGPDHDHEGLADDESSS